MASINEVFNLVKYRANKAGFNGNISPDDFNLLFPRAEIRYYNKLYAQYYKTQRISDSLSKFMSDPTAITILGTGRYTFPSDLFHVDSITALYGGVQYPVIRVEKDRIAAHLPSTYDAPNTQFPIYTEYKTFLQFYPVTLGTASLVYLKAPAKSFWNYTLVGGRPVFSVSGSTDSDFSDTDLDNIIYKVLMDMGINMRDAELEKFSQIEQQTEI